MRYEYTDLDADRLIIEAPGWPANTASVSVHGNAVFVKADEAPKAAQAILDAAGVQGVPLTDLPEVVKVENGNYATSGFTSYYQSSLTAMENEAKALVAIWLQHKADEADKERQVADATAFTAEAATKKAHDDLRTSPIALKALALYNRGLIGRAPYASWDATADGLGAADYTVRSFIEQAEEAEAKEKEAAEKLAARRLDIYKELGGAFPGNVSWDSPMGKAVDRIIELEDAK